MLVDVETFQTEGYAYLLNIMKITKIALHVKYFLSKKHDKTFEQTTKT